MPTTTSTSVKKTFKRVLHLRCGKCEWGWYPLGGIIPKVCPKCKRLIPEAPVES